MGTVSYRDALDGLAQTEAFWHRQRERYGKHGSAAIAQYSNGWSLSKPITMLRREYEGRKGDPDHDASVSFDRFMEEMYKAITETLRESAIYYAAPQIVDLLSATSETLPPTVLHDTLLPSRCGFLWLAEPIPYHRLMSETERDRYTLSIEDIMLGMTKEEVASFPIDRRRALDAQMPLDLRPRVRAFSWHPLSCFQRNDDVMRERVSLNLYMDYDTLTLPHRRKPERYGYEWGAVMNYGEEVWGPTMQRHGEQGLMFCLRWLIASFLFMQQKITVTSNERVQNRGARRALANTLRREPPDVRVIQLRERETAQAASGEHRSVAWSCQWAVRGHWRQQPYRSTGTVQPKFILPYVKGPADKPLRVRPTVAVLSR